MGVGLGVGVGVGVDIGWVLVRVGVRVFCTVDAVPVRWRVLTGDGDCPTDNVWRRRLWQQRELTAVALPALAAVGRS